MDSHIVRKSGSQRSGGQESERPGAGATDRGFRQAGEDGLPFLEDGRGHLCPSRSTHRMMHSVGSALGAGNYGSPGRGRRLCGAVGTEYPPMAVNAIYAGSFTPINTLLGDYKMDWSASCDGKLAGPHGRCTGVMDQAVSRGTLLCRCVATASTLPSAAAPYPQPRPDTDCVVLR